MSSVFSRKITMSTASGCFTGDGTPGNQRTGPQAHVQVEDLAQRDVQRTDAAADRRRQRALDPDEVLAERGDGLVGQPRAGRVERLLAGEHFLPRDRLAVLGRRRVHHELRGGPDVDAGAVAFDEGDDGLVGHRQRPVGLHRDLLGHAGKLMGGEPPQSCSSARVSPRPLISMKSLRSASSVVDTKGAAGYARSGLALTTR